VPPATGEDVADKSVYLASPSKDGCRIYLHLDHVSTLAPPPCLWQIRSHLRKEMDDGESYLLIKI
jgi:hypothetical protein